MFAEKLANLQQSMSRIPETEAVQQGEQHFDNHFTRQYIPEDNSEHHTRRRENLKSHNVKSSLESR
jgi:hypothetical protein